MNKLVLENKFVRYIVLPGLFSIIILIGFTFFVYNSMGEQARPNLYNDMNDLPAENIALVLGAFEAPDGNSENSYEKLVAAAEMYRIGKVKKVLLSGVCESGQHETCHETLVDMGVAADDIVMDKTESKTFDAVIRAKKIYGLQSLILVSHKDELERALFICQSQGMAANGYAPDIETSSSIAGEYIARLKTYMDCNVFGAKPKYLGRKEFIRF